MTSIRRNPPLRDDDLLTTDEVALWLRVSPRTVREWRFDERGPAWLRVEGQIRYRTSVVAAWLASNESEIPASSTPGGGSTRVRSRRGAQRP